MVDHPMRARTTLQRVKAPAEFASQPPLSAPEGTPWFHFDDTSLVVEGGIVTGWTDIGPDTRTLNAVGGPPVVDPGLNGLRHAELNGVDQAFVSMSPPQAGASNLITLVARSDAITGNNNSYFGRSTGTGGSQTLNAMPDGVLRVGRYLGPFHLSSPGVITTGAWHIIQVFTRSSATTSGDHLTVWVDGDMVIDVATEDPYRLLATALGRNRGGALASSTQYLHGSLAEVIAYNGSSVYTGGGQSVIDLRVPVLEFLASKWGL